MKADGATVYQPWQCSSRLPGGEMGPIPPKSDIANQRFYANVTVVKNFRVGVLCPRAARMPPPFWRL